MAYPYQELIFDILGGADTLNDPSDIPQIPRQPTIGTLDPGTPVRMVQAQDVWAPNNRYDLQTRPGFTDIWATGATISSVKGIITGMQYQGAIADRLLVTASHAAQRHTLWYDNSGTATEITLGTNLTIGQDNLMSLLNFTDGTNAGTILLSLQRDLPQFVNSSAVASNFTISGTGLTSLKPQFGVVFAPRALYANCDQDGTVIQDRV